MFNKVILVGNLTRDIELRYTQGGTAIAKTAIATSRKFTSNGEKKEEVCFIDITFFGRSGEVANQYLRKGSKVLVEGRIVFEQWVDNNGQKRSKHSVAVESMQMLDTKGDNQGQQQPAQQNEPQQYQSRNDRQSTGTYGQQAPTVYKDKNGRPTPPPNSVPEIDIDEDEIPF